jgi:hypothetical protein
VIAAFVVVCISVNKVVIPNIKYSQAVKLMEEEKYEEAASAFEEMNGYKDSSEKQQEAIEKYQEYLLQAEFITLTEAEIGDTVTFGNYYTSNEWVVLDEKDGCKLLISKYAIETKYYNEKDVTTTWENSSIRNWLNSVFVDIAFDDYESQIIKYTNVVNDDNRQYDIAGGNDTEDEIFLLSIDEFEKYYPDGERLTLHEGVFVYWWLRSPGKNSDYAAYVSGSGKLEYFGCNVARQKYGIRPALWIDVTNY